MFGVAPSDPDLVRRVTGRSVLPSRPVAELWAIKGRGGGGSRFGARLACYFACGRTYRLVPGERIYIGVFAPDRRQAALTFRYIEGLIDSVPALAALVISRTRESIELSTGVVIEVITAGTAQPRGRAYALVIVEEAAFLPTDESADPDRELLRAVRPALARVPGSLLALISSPYAARGELHRAYVERYGRDDDDTLVVMADTATLNPSFSQREIDRAFRDDPVAARSEYGRDGVIEFRSDVASFVAEEAIAAVVPTGVRELPPDPTRTACGHFDAATGSGSDAAALGIAFVGTPTELAVARRWVPPFSPASVAAEAAALFTKYGIREITIDRFAPGLVADLFRAHGIACPTSDSDTSATFAELLTLVNSQTCRLLDNKDLLRELRGLERRVMTGGRDRIGHRLRGHDDVAAACASSLVMAASQAAWPELRVWGGGGAEAPGESFEELVERRGSYFPGDSGSSFRTPDTWRPHRRTDGRRSEFHW